MREGGALRGRYNNFFGAINSFTLKLCPAEGGVAATGDAWRGAGGRLPPFIKRKGALLYTDGCALWCDIV